MNSSRLEQLKALLEEDPKDAFVRYAIALEMRHAGNMSEAALLLDELIKDDPMYTPGYYQLASVLIALGRNDEAVHVCDAGSMRCQMTGDLKARAELLELKAAITGDA